MEHSRVDTYLMCHAGCFKEEDILAIKTRLEAMTEDKFTKLLTIELRNPITMFFMSIFFGIERFFIGSVGTGVLKLITLNGLGIWWLIDLFTVIRRTKEYNFRIMAETI